MKYKNVKTDDEELVSIGMAAQILGVCTNTLLNWEEKGLIHPVKTNGGHRRFRKDDVMSLKAKQIHQNRYTIAYCREPYYRQNAHMEKQVRVVTDYCIGKGYDFRVITDKEASRFSEAYEDLMKRICLQEVDRVVVTHKDRISVIGGEDFERLCFYNGVKIESLDLAEGKAAKKEIIDEILSLVEDLMFKLLGPTRSREAVKVRKQTEGLINEYCKHDSID